MRSHSLLAATFFAITLFAVNITGQKLECYGLDGQKSNSGYVPCNQGASVSSCCAPGGDGDDMCLASGLCLASKGPYAGFIYGNGCTDSTGEDEACPKVCTKDKFESGKMPHTYNLLQCTPGTWCCRDTLDTRNCCNSTDTYVKWSPKGDSIFLLEIVIGRTIPTSTQSGSKESSSSTGVTTNTSGTMSGLASCPAGNNTSSAHCNNGNMMSKATGAAIGAPLGIALLAALGGLAWMAIRVRELQRERDSHYPRKLLMNSDQHNVFSQPPVYSSNVPRSVRRFELQSPPAELSEGPNSVEMRSGYSRLR